MSKWRYNGKPLTEPPQDVWGFVYEVRWDGGFYIGQKSFWSKRNVKLSKKKSTELWSGKGRKPTKQEVIKESDWKKYCTSSTFVKSLVAELGESKFEWNIISLAKNKTDLNYQESKYLMCTDAILHPQCANDWISIKIRKNNV